MEKEKTLVLLKPDIILRGLVGEVLQRFERVGLKIIGIKMIQASEEVLEKHYEKTDEWLEEAGKRVIDNKGYPEDYDPKEAGKEIVNGLVQDLQFSPIIAIVLEGHNAVKTVKRLTGPTNIDEALPGTIRGDYSHDTFTLANKSNRALLTVIHATDDPHVAEKEVHLWFADTELHSYIKPEESVHYRKGNEKI